MIKERPILFSAPMVRAILDERKTQTRRVVKQPIPPEIKSIKPYINNKAHEVFGWHLGTSEKLGDLTELANLKCPYGKIGERLWVRETFCVVDDTQFEGDKWIDYRATPRYSESHPAGWDNDPENPEALTWKPSIHMPRIASRILLEITNIRVERLQDISEEDAMDEGVGELDFDAVEYCEIAKKIGGAFGDHKPSFIQLWESINGQGSWDLNPWVWVVEFKVIEKCQ